MTKKHKLTYLSIFLLVISMVILKFMAISWEKQQMADSKVSIKMETTPKCNINYCEFSDGLVVETKGKVSSKTPFTVLISNVPHKTQKAYIYFSMDSMDMGFNRFNLIESQGRLGQWQTKPIILPVCAIKDDKYIMNICFDDCTKPYIIRFVAK